MDNKTQAAAAAAATLVAAVAGGAHAQSTSTANSLVADPQATSAASGVGTGTGTGIGTGGAGGTGGALNASLAAGGGSVGPINIPVTTAVKGGDQTQLQSFAADLKNTTTSTVTTATSSKTDGTNTLGADLKTGDASATNGAITTKTGASKSTSSTGAVTTKTGASKSTGNTSGNVTIEGATSNYHEASNNPFIAVAGLGAIGQVTSAVVGVLPVWVNSRAGVRCDLDLNLLVEHSTHNAMMDRDKPIETPLLAENDKDMSSEYAAIKRAGLPADSYVIKSLKTGKVLGVQYPCGLKKEEPRQEQPIPIPTTVVTPSIVVVKGHVSVGPDRPKPDAPKPPELSK